MSSGFLSAAADGSSSLLLATKVTGLVTFFIMLFTVYVLFSDKNDKHYTGFTSNLEQRLLSHSELGNDWTKSYRPWRLIYTKEFVEKLEAMQHEKWLKTGAGRDFIKTLVL